MNFKTGVVKCTFLGLFLACAWSSLSAQDIRLMQPIEGEYLKDFFIVHYVDQRGEGEISDAHCGSKTYDGHEGTDFVLRNFAQMDAGVKVFAVAPGTVIAAVDGLFDRNKEENDGQLGNYVGIEHANGIFTYYAHLRKNSVAVQIGQTVQAGDVLGLVGSSGNSTDPHLHLEVWRADNTVIDPFDGECGDELNWWLDDLPYNDELLLIDQGMLSGTTTLNDLRERPATETEFKPGSTDEITFWVQQSGIRQGDVSRIEWLQPDGTLWFSFETSAERDWWFFYWWSFIDYPQSGEPGSWTARYTVNGKVVTQQQFQVGNPSSVANNGTINPQSAHNAAIKMHAAEREIRISAEYLTDDMLIKIYDLNGRLLRSVPVHRTAPQSAVAHIPADITGRVILNLHAADLHVSVLHAISPD